MNWKIKIKKIYPVKSNCYFIGIIFLPVLLFCIFGIAEKSDATPSVVDISGNIIDGEQISISGSGFGIKNSISPLLWDNAEDSYASTIDGDAVPIDSDIYNGYPFRANEDSSMKFATNQSQLQRGRSLAHYFGNSRYNYFRGYNYNPAGLNNGFPELYLTWYIKTDSLSTSASTKLIRLWATEHNGRTYRLSWTTSQLGYFYNKDIATENDPWASVNYDLVNDWNTWDGEAELNEWHRLEVYYKSSSNYNIADGKILIKTDGRIEHDIDLATWIEETPALPEYINQYPRGGNDPLNNVYLIGFDPSVDIGSYAIEMDDFYIDNTLARIEICDGNVFQPGSKMHCEIQIPTIWSDNSITFVVNQGSFNNGDTAYLYVVDENGEVNENGYPITIGEGSSDIIAPASPGGLLVL